MKVNEHTWSSEVRSHELDNQGIVNNAVYMTYFANARILFLQQLGINWDEWHKKGVDLILYKAEITFKYPLRAFDKFYIKSSYTRSGKTKIIFHQDLINNNYHKISATCESISVCVDAKTNKVICPEPIVKLLFN